MNHKISRKYFQAPTSRASDTHTVQTFFIDNFPPADLNFNVLDLIGFIVGRADQSIPLLLQFFVDFGIPKRTLTRSSLDLNVACFIINSVSGGF